MDSMHTAAPPYTRASPRCSRLWPRSCLGEERSRCGSAIVWTRTPLGR
ncbi:unnamed protein product [Ranitomeya imitator]|uniref:Uncharacterized protein n=1 Tax=Ranitomeya imitator TaxID=111125 RepID=A0ABN9LEB9_9NEOB|nr:unnamed protein product [Ranitomeya imitator]